MEYQIIVVGIGPGAPEYLSPAAKAALEQATALAGSARALAMYTPQGAKTMAITGKIGETIAFVAENLAHGDVTVMVSGDPGYYSLLAALRERFAPQRLRVIPSISSMQLAFARLALPWQNAQLLSFHGRTPDGNALQWREDKVLGMLTDATHSSKKIAEILYAHQWPPKAKLYICARLSYEDEKIRATSVAEAMRQAPIPHCILIAIGETETTG